MSLTFHQQIKDAIHKQIDRMIYVAGPQAKLRVVCQPALWTIGFTGSQAIQCDPGEKESACRPQKRMKSERS